MGRHASLARAHADSDVEHLSSAMVQRARFDAPRPFKIAIPQDRLDRAQKLVELTDLAPFYANALDGAETDVDEDCTYGLSVPRIRALLEHLQSGKFDWRAHEAKLQAMGEHSIVHVDGIEGADYALDVHVVVARSSKADATPLLVRCNLLPCSLTWSAHPRLAWLDLRVPQDRADPAAELPRRDAVDAGLRVFILSTQGRRARRAAHCDHLRHRLRGRHARRRLHRQIRRAGRRLVRRSSWSKL